MERFYANFTIMKYLNAILNGSSYVTSLASGKPFIWGMPPAIGIELTNHCNLKCAECPSGAGMMKRGRGFMNIDAFKIVVGELRPFLLNLNLYFQGEPMLHPHFFSFLNETTGIHSTVSTNGHYINEDNARKLAESGLNRIIISLDGISEEAYSKYRIHGDLQKVMNGIFTLSSAIKKSGSRLKVEIQVLKNRYNEHEIPEIGKIAKRAGAHLSLKTMQVYDPRQADKWMPSDPNYCRYKKDGSSFRIKSNLPRRCARLWYNPVITWDMKVVPCCFDKDAEHIMGDLSVNSFREIWHGSKYATFRLKVLSDRKEISICQNCDSGLQVKE